MVHHFEFNKNVLEFAKRFSAIKKNQTKAERFNFISDLGIE